jgi:hypothetical protein
MLIARSTLVPTASISDAIPADAHPKSRDAIANGERADTLSIDRHLRESILEGLAQRGIRVSHELTLDVDHRVVTVRGRVESYYQRQLIVHSIRLVPGVGELKDAVDVVPPADPRRSLCQPQFVRSRWGTVSKVTALLAVALLLW